MVPTQTLPENKRPQETVWREVSQNVRGNKQQGGGATQTSQSQLYDDLKGGGVKSPDSLLIG